LGAQYADLEKRETGDGDEEWTEGVNKTSSSGEGVPARSSARLRNANKSRGVDANPMAPDHPTLKFLWEISEDYSPEEDEETVRVGPSLVAPNTLGAYANVKLPGNSPVAKYAGEYIRRVDEEHRKNDSIACAVGMCGYVVGDRTRSYGPYINDPLDEVRANVELVWTGRELWVYTLRDGVEAGEELLLCYGGEWWLMRFKLGLEPENLVDRATLVYPDIEIILEDKEKVFRDRIFPAVMRPKEMRLPTKTQQEDKRRAADNQCL
jgi:hypothetical protein